MVAFVSHLAPMLFSEEKTVAMEPISHGVCISLEKSHDVMGHKVLLGAVVHDVTSFVNVLTLMLEQMVVEKVLHCPHKRTIILHFCLDRDCTHYDQNNR